MDQSQSTQSNIQSALLTRYNKYFSTTPKHINYNSYISDNSLKNKGKYRLRNCRQLKLKVSSQQDKYQKLNSYKGIKEIMKINHQKQSTKRIQYDHNQGVKDNNVIQKLTTQLNFFKRPRIPHKNRCKRNKKYNQIGIMFDVQGKVVNKKSQINEDFLKQVYKNDQKEFQKNGFYNYEQKYRTKYFHKLQLKKRQKQAERYQLQLPLTGWN